MTKRNKAIIKWTAIFLASLTIQEMTAGFAFYLTFLFVVFFDLAVLSYIGNAPERISKIIQVEIEDKRYECEKNWEEVWKCE